MKKLNVISLALLFICMFIISCEETPMDAENEVITKPLTNKEKSVVASNNEFAIKLFREIDKQDTTENIFISPISIGMALAMTYNGSDGETKEEMKNLLGFDSLEDSSVNTAYGGIYDQLMNMDNLVNISLANSIWYAEGFSVNQDFENILNTYYDAEIKPLDVSDPNAKDIINQWVESKTNNKIKDLIQVVKPLDVMFLVNAIYYYADWTYQFDKEKTVEADFYKDESTIVKCQMMEALDIPVKVRSTDYYQLVELPYGNKQFGMVIIIPGDNAMDDVLYRLSAEDINNLLSDTSTTEFTVNMPKFKIEYDITLNEVLKTLGMPTAFSSGAEFPYLLNEMTEDLYIDRVRHKAFIEVDEEGTEAAAATAVVITYKMAKPSIYLNKPFLYLIRENHTGTILFIGKMDDPS